MLVAATNDQWISILTAAGGFILMVGLTITGVWIFIRYRGGVTPDQLAAFFAILVLGGLIISIPPLVLVGGIGLTGLVLARITARYALTGLSYSRQLTPNRLFPDEQAELVTRLRNDKLLPLAWLTIRDSVWLGTLTGHRNPNELLRFADGVQLVDNVDPVLINRGAVGPFQDLSRTYRVKAMHRGVYAIGPAKIESGDPFGFYPRTSTIGTRQEIIVYPRLYRPDEIGFALREALGELIVRRALHEDPALIAGSREYRPGDPLRLVEWKATARRRDLQVRVSDPSLTANLMILLNLRTFRYYWEGMETERMEEAIRLAGSLAHWALEKGFPVGLHSNGVLATADSDDEATRLAPSASPRQATVILEHLARLSFAGRYPIEQILLEETRRLREGTSIVLVTAMVTAELERLLSSPRIKGRISVVYCGGYPAPVSRSVPIYFSSPQKAGRRANS